MNSDSVLYYCKELQKDIPAKLKTNFFEIHETHIGKRFYVKCEYDFDEFLNYNVTKEEVYRYCNEVVQINEVYPATTQAEIDYFDLVKPNLITNVTDHEHDELDRFEKLVSMICDFTGDLDIDVFFNLAQFIGYELLFTYCNYTERVFFQTLTLSVLTEQPDPVEIPQMVRMTRTIFNNIDITHHMFNLLKNGASSNKLYKLFNIRRYSEFDYIPFPMLIDVDNLRLNCDFIIC